MNEFFKKHIFVINYILIFLLSHGGSLSPKIIASLGMKILLTFKMILLIKCLLYQSRSLTGKLNTHIEVNNRF